jgi:ketosteroid isomerase-like protein
MATPTPTVGPPSIESVVRAYFANVSDLASPEEALRALLAPDVTVTEHPNAVTPAGAIRDRDATLAGFRAGKALLAEQRFEVHEVLTQGERAAVRATWRGVVARDAGPFSTGQELVAHVAALLTVRDGAVTAHETFDCYEPFGRS